MNFLLKNFVSRGFIRLRLIWSLNLITKITYMYTSLLLMALIWTLKLAPAMSYINSNKLFIQIFFSNISIFGSVLMRLVWHKEVNWVVTWWMITTKKGTAFKIYLNFTCHITESNHYFPFDKQNSNKSTYVYLNFKHNHLLWKRNRNLNKTLHFSLCDNYVFYSSMPLLVYLK
jgi:hypothetical protein